MLRHFLVAVAVSLVGLSTTLVANAQSVVLPSGYSGTEGTTRDYYTFETTASTYQIILDPSQVAGLTGGSSTITGLSFRLDTSGASVPTASFTNYDIYIGQEASTINATTTTSFSTTFGNNVAAGTNQQVRSGALSISNTGYTAGTPNSFGPAITFDTPYLYTGGGLVITISQSGSGATFSPYMDATAPVAGIGYVVRDAAFGGGSFFNSSYATIATTTGYRDASTTNYGFPVFKLSYTSAAAPEPASLALLGSAALFGAGFRRRRRAA